MDKLIVLKILSFNLKYITFINKKELTCDNKKLDKLFLLNSKEEKDIN